jgi:hypothetical protein
VSTIADPHTSASATDGLDRETAEALIGETDEAGVEIGVETPGETDADERGGATDDGNASGSGRSAGSSHANKNLIRRVATKTVEVLAAGPAEVAVVVNLLGLSASMVPAGGESLSGEAAASITTAIMTAPRSATAALSDLTSIATASGAEQGIVAMTMGRVRLRGVWSLLGSLGIKGFTSAVPGSDPKAALALVAGVGGLSARDNRTLESARSLLRKP